MEKTKHAGGQWNYHINDMGKCYQIWDKGTLIAHVYGKYDLDPKYIILPIENARLIASAPDLLEACKEVMANIRAMTSFIPYPTIECLEAAIIRAEGRE